MNIQREEVSPDNLTSEEMDELVEDCPCCGSNKISYDGWEYDDDFGFETYSCNDCDSYWQHDFKVEFLCTYIKDDRYHTYKRWLAENRDKKIDEILND